MTRRCGDDGFLRWEVEDPLIGEVGVIHCRRTEEPADSGTVLVEIEQGRMLYVRWPDQEKQDGSYYGGRKVNFTGLAKLGYQERWNHQKFQLSFTVRDKEKVSAETAIEGYPDKGRTPVNEGIACAVTVLDARKKEWWRRIFSRHSHEAVVVRQYPKETRFPNCGKYHVELKHGVIWITLKISYDASHYVRAVAAQMGTTVEQYCNERILNFWNGDRGFGGWIYHRKRCRRKRECACPVTWREGSDPEFMSACCKIPIRLQIESGSDLEVKVWDHSTWPMVRQSSREVANTGNFPFPEPHSDTYAHEAGHFMGFPDQYFRGHTATNLRAWPISATSVMGGANGAQKEAHEPHVKHFMKYIPNLLGEAFELIKL